MVDAYRGVPGGGVCEASVAHAESKLRKWGDWLKARRPRPTLEAIDVQLLVRYVQSRSVFRSKATVSDLLSTMRCFGEYLVREGSGGRTRCAG